MIFLTVRVSRESAGCLELAMIIPENEVITTITETETTLLHHLTRSLHFFIYSPSILLNRKIKYLSVIDIDKDTYNRCSVRLKGNIILTYNKENLDEGHIQVNNAYLPIKSKYRRCVGDIIDNKVAEYALNKIKENLND